MMVGVLGSLAEYERELIRERTALKRQASPGMASRSANQRTGTVQPWFSLIARSMNCPVVSVGTRSIGGLQGSTTWRGGASRSIEVDLSAACCRLGLFMVSENVFDTPALASASFC